MVCTGDGDDGWWDHGFDIQRRVGCGAWQAAMQRGSTLSLHGWRPGLGIGDVRASPGNACAATGWLLRQTGGGVECLISDSVSFLFYFYLLI